MSVHLSVNKISIITQQIFVKFAAWEYTKISLKTFQFLLKLVSNTQHFT
jgi:ATP phosphoribosyltransferase regulatory subunit HisZ